MQDPDEEPQVDWYSGLTYEEAKRQYLELGDAIRRRYERELTAMSLDVVHSRTAKGTGSALDAQLTYDAYHRWVEDELEHAGCKQFTWAGDGLLALFEHPERAVGVGRALLEALPMFNRRHNRLERPMQIRVGVHTGRALPGEAAGVGKIASSTFDIAGHLQKAALPNQMLVSETTYSLLRDVPGPLVPVRKDIPSPGTCFAYPPETAAFTAPGTLPPPAYSPAPVAPSSPPRWPWVVAGIGALAAVGGLALVLTSGGDKAAPGNGGSFAAVGQTDFSQQSTPPAPDEGGSKPVTGGPTRPTAPARQPAVSGPGTPASTPAWGPATTPWRSPDANSAVPVQIVESPPELRWLLAIGVGKYRDPAFTFEGGGASATAAAQAIARAAAVPPGHVRVLADEQATLAGIKQAFVDLQRAASSGRDTIFVYLAGAADHVPPRPGGPGGGSVYAFAPHDANPEDPGGSMVYGSDIAGWLGATRAQLGFVVADTPYAAGIGAPAVPDAGRRLGVFASADRSQRAATVAGQGGVFTAGLLLGLQGGADRDGDRRISLQELGAYLAAEVPRATGGSQTPKALTGFGAGFPEMYLAAPGPR